MNRIKNRVGERIGKLVVIELVGQTERSNAIWLCQCDCGNTAKVVSMNLREGNTTSCGCNKHKDRLPPGESSINQIFKSYKYSANRRNIVFEITKEKFLSLVNSSCYYCKSAPSRYFKNHNAKVGVYYNGIDRLDNTQGYTTNNVVPCCTSCNRAKSEMSIDEFKIWLNRVYKNRKNF